jgi:Flp pilus assembly protein TadG
MLTARIKETIDMKRLGGWRQFDDRGNAAMIVGLCAVPLALVVGGVMELEDIAAARGNLQAAVDAGALAGAQRLGIANAGSTDVQAAAVTAADADLSAGFHGTGIAYTVTEDTKAETVTVTATARHIPLLGVMGFGNSELKAAATADALGSVPLCVLQTGTDKQDSGIHAQDHAMIRATGCAVQANTDINVDPSALIQAARVEAAGTVKGPVAPAGYSGALTIADPFASMDLSVPTACDGKPVNYKVVANTTLTLAPGVHCEHFDIDTGATLQLLPGDHWFMDDLNAHNNAVIQGDDVVLIFGSNKKINFFDNSAARLTARKSGPYAGFLIMTTRDNTQEFDIASNNVSELLGTIYIPNARLVIDTTGNVAQDSAWSIIVADDIELHHNPDLVINTNYVGSGVPVPQGVGPSQKASLVK